MCQFWALYVVTKRQFFYIYVYTDPARHAFSVSAPSICWSSIMLQHCCTQTIFKDRPVNSWHLAATSHPKALDSVLLLLARLMASVVLLAGVCCLSSVGVVCRRLNSAGGRAGRRAHGRSGGRHYTAGQYVYVSLGRHLIIITLAASIAESAM